MALLELVVQPICWNVRFNAARVLITFAVELTID